VKTGDVIELVEDTVKEIVTKSKTRYIMLKTKRLVHVNPRLRTATVPKVGWALSYVLWKYQQQGLVKILYEKKGHTAKFYIYVTDTYYEQLEKQLQPQTQAPTPTTS